MKVLLVEDHAATREEVTSLISREKDLSVVAQVRTAEEAIETAKRLLPDVVVMDIFLPGMNGIEATRCILSERPQTRVLALSNYSGPALVQAILHAGGLGYVRKNRAFEELIPAIRSVGEGRQYVSTGSADGPL
jgi:DNA-binding NarL/FixJ family response regulator